MCYSEWSRKELEALEKARREAAELTKRAIKPKPAGGVSAPQPTEKQPEGQPEPVAG
jgi:hypothetical protein